LYDQLRLKTVIDLSREVPRPQNSINPLRAAVRRGFNSHSIISDKKDTARIVSRPISQFDKIENAGDSFDTWSGVTK